MDYEAAISLDEFREMVKNIKDTKSMLNSDFRLTNLKKKEYRRSFHSKRDIKKGEILSWDNLKISRPEDGIEPKFYKEVFGKTIKQNLKEREALQWEMI